MKKNTNGTFSSARVLTGAAMLTAVSVVIGMICKNLFTFNVYYRLTFENLPVIISGLIYGPVVGALCGICADIVSCLCSTNPAVNPIITVGAACVGIVSGLVPKFIIKKRCNTQYALSVLLAHLFGQVIIKSIGKLVFFGMPWWGIFICVCTSAVAGSVEYIIIRWLMNSTSVMSYIRGYDK